MHTITSLSNTDCNYTGPARAFFFTFFFLLVFQETLSLQSNKVLNCIKCRDTTEDCVDTTMFNLQATVFFSNNRAELNGSGFARAVWSCFSIQGHGEKWRPSINISSYQWVLGKSNQGGFVPLLVGLCRRYHFPLWSALLYHLNSTLSYSGVLSYRRRDAQRPDSLQRRRGWRECHRHGTREPMYAAASRVRWHAICNE